MCLFIDNTSRIEEKISKGRKTLNASTGLGIRKNGLNMGTCNIVFWQVVVPTITFGSEVWVSSETDDELLLNFQRYAGRRVQRFPQRSPNGSSFYGLGWIKLTLYIQIKKLLFILTILMMEPLNVIRRVFELRLSQFSTDTTKCRENRFKSPIFDILEVAINFGLYSIIKDMTLNETPVPSKKTWSNLVWRRAWKIQDANWRAANIILKENDLLSLTIGDTKYLTWWYLSDLDHRLISMCENMSKILCHASMLKKDDYRLKGMPMSNRTCIHCAMYCIEDIIHIINQCPFYAQERYDMYNEIYKICPNAKRLCENKVELIPYFLLGRRIPEMEENEMIWFWCISGEFINRMYKKAISSRKGIG